MPSADDLAWIELTDFSPGIFSNNNLAGGLNVTSTNLALASPTNTYRCRALPTGGLGPLPRRKYDFALTDPPGTNATTRYVNGLGTWGQVLLSSGNNDGNHRVEVHLPISYTTGGTYDNEMKWVRERIFADPATTETILTQTSAGDGQPERVQFAFLMKTRTTEGAPLDPGQPVMVLVYAGAARGMNTSRAQPDPSSPTTNSNVVMGAETDHIWRRAVAHQGRIVFGDLISYGRGDNVVVSTEENIWWTAVNDVAMSTTDAQVFVSEVDQSIADWASMSANQLVVVKSIGGGYVLTGDLEDVTVVRLPNLMSPDGAETVQGCNTAIGWVYSAGDRGLYVWNGGDASAPLSNQLDGQAFTETGGISFAEGSHRGQCDRWMDLLLAPDLWACDLFSEARGWWRLDDPDEATYEDRPVCYFSSTKFEAQMVGAHAAFTQDADTVFYIWEYADLAYSYSWQSHPLWATQGRRIQIRQGLVALQGHGTVTLTLIGDDPDNTFTHTLDIDSDTIRNFRFDIAMDAENLTIRVEASGNTGSGPGTAEAPLTHRVYLAYRTAPSLANANNQP